MLKDAREAEIMARARQAGLREVARPAAPFDAIVEDFNLAERVAQRRILDLGPGQFDFGEIVRSLGGELVAVDNDPAVLRLGAHRGYVSHDLDIRTLRPSSALGTFDGLFCRGSLNALWFDEDEELLTSSDCLAALLRADGWAWLAPWNYPQDEVRFDRRRYMRLVYAQFVGLTRNAFMALHLPADRTGRYGLWDGVLQEGATIYVRNLTVRRDLLQYVVTRSDFEGFLAATGRTTAGGSATVVTQPPDVDPVAAPTPEAPPTAERSSRDVDPITVRTPGERIIADFGLASRCSGARVLSVGAGDFGLARAAREAGASEVVIIERNAEIVDEAVALGFKAQHLNPRAMLGGHELGEYDVVLCKGSINGFWFGLRHAEHERWVAALAALVKPGGAAWIAPWNALAQPSALTERDSREIIETQLGAFLAEGFVAYELDDRAASKYVLSSDVENLVLFTKGIDAERIVGAEVRTAMPERARPPRGRRASRHAPSTASRPFPVLQRPTIALPNVPVEYHAGLLDLLAANPEVFNVITYDDLPWGEDVDHAGSYPSEWATWLAQVREQRDPRIHVLVQHDVDAYPELTNALVSYEALVGVRTNIMIFRRTHDRQLLEREARLEFRRYDVDIPLLQQLQREHGFVIGYHANCMEHALWDADAAERLFVEDVEVLRRSFPIRYFSPHGGIARNDLNNTSLQIPAQLRGSLRWVHNRYAPRFHGYWSDGGFGRMLPGDLRDFVRTWQPGCRYRILTHPQHYGMGAVERDYRLEWYRELFRAYEAGQRDFWADVWPDALS